MQILYTIYLILICTVLPIYMKDGYYELGEAKALGYLVMSAPFAALMIYNVIFSAKSRKPEKATSISLTEFFMYGTAFSMAISLLFSVDKKVAFTGYAGWRNGFLISFIALAIGFAFSKSRFIVKDWLIVLILVFPFFEFVLSILNRFSIYPILFNGQGNSFLATIGNINWYCGFLSIWVPLGIGIMYLQKKFSWKFWACGVYVVTGLVALFLQGSNGGSLILLASYLLLLWWSLSSREGFYRFLIQLFVLGLSMFIVYVTLWFASGSYNYEGNLLVSICEANIGIILMAAAFFIYRVSRLFEEIKVPFRERLYKSIAGVGIVLLIGVGSVWTVLSFSDDFGNGRGIIYRMCLDIYMGLPSWQKLVGIGQDCLYPYAMADAIWSSSFRNVFGELALTNAHCELLSVLIERGLLGAFLYLGLFVSVILMLFRVKEKEPKAVSLGLPIISYFVFNQISFSQVMSMPYLYILIGMATTLSEIGNRN
ncbi:O-antigen ligase family protein [Butyrivibrio sp. VCB2006]|uniref:O-antigen ligase family protein n=1 Tax=Butyrivibrio sp. VCB2006 TaxID=1280679 RepID=UPI000423499D|nr:O-antigen ligase family protein [Butyrivibrio sp. VCB2006]